VAKIPCGKMRDKENPWEVYKGFGPLEGWEWRVLKKYQGPKGEAENPYARWMCAVKSPMTYGSFDMGDTYISDVLNGHTKLVEVDGIPVENPVFAKRREPGKMPF